MYRYDHKPAQSLAVWYFNALGPEEWNLHSEHLKQLATWFPKTKQRPACLLVMRGFAVPNEAQRKRLAELTSAPGYCPYIAFVTPNKAAQTVLTLINWFNKKPEYETKFFVGEADAISWLEQKRGMALPMLRKMATDLIAAAEPKTAVASS